MLSKPISKKKLINRIYNNACARVEGIGSRPRTKHLYRGLSIMPRAEFTNWAEKHPVFNRLYENFAATGFDNRFAPSPDRLKSGAGYTKENIEWVPYSENCRRGAKTGHQKHMSTTEALTKFRYEVNRFMNRINEIPVC